MRLDLDCIGSEATATANKIPDVRSGNQPEAVRATGVFWDVMRQPMIRVALLSVALVVPCFWHKGIGGGDLRSHVYNAWLVQLIQRGQAPGLWIAPQRNNVLFDYLLSALARSFSLQHTAHIASAIAVLVFFWGSSAFVSAISGRSARPIVPILAAACYGWTFQEGLMNYYLALGISFAGLSVFLRRNAWGVWAWIAFVALAALAFLAQPLGAAWMLGAAAYLAIAKVIPWRRHALLVLLAIAALLVLRLQLLSHFRDESIVTPLIGNPIFYNGLDQLAFSNRYVPLMLVLATLFLAAIVGELKRQNGVRGVLAECAIPLGLYVIVQSSILLLPNSLHLPAYPGTISGLSTRVTLISATLLCALMASIPSRAWRLPALSFVAAVFFFYLYQDTAVIARMENQAQELVSSVSAGQRVISTVGGPRHYRFSLKHLTDAACIGHCFSYGNYEAPSGQFRVRAAPGNPVVVSNIFDASLIEDGRYVVRSTDLPLYQLYQCSSDWAQLCIRPLKAGEINDLYGVHPGNPPKE